MALRPDGGRAARAPQGAERAELIERRLISPGAWDWFLSQLSNGVSEGSAGNDKDTRPAP